MMTTVVRTVGAYILLSLLDDVKGINSEGGSKLHKYNKPTWRRKNIINFRSP